MKKSFLMAFMAMAFTGFLVSCEEDDEHLRNRTEDDIEWNTINVTVRAGDWEYVEGSRNCNSYYYADVKVSDLDKNKCKGGIICCYLYDDEVQTQLPCTRYYNSGNEEWSRTIDYDFYKKGVTFYVTESRDSINLPERMEFRIAFIY